MGKLTEQFKIRLSDSLRRKSVVSASRWACEYRIIPKTGKKWTFDKHPWLKEMHDSTANINIGQKSAQMGYTETVLNKTFYNIDIRKLDCLYILPTKTPDASDFSASRFDGALEVSEHLQQLFSEVKNVGHKRAGGINLYIRGSNSRSGLKSLPVSFLVLDELDEMHQKNIRLAMERTSGQDEKEAWKISTPTFFNRGINAEFNNSTQEHFFFKCPSCNQYIEFIFPDSLVITSMDKDSPEIFNSHYICIKCKNILHQEDKINFLSKGIWQKTKENKINRGFYINQMYSTAVKPYEFAISYLEGLKDKSSEQEFWNSKMGLPHAVEKAQITDAEFDKCIGNYTPFTNYMVGTNPITMGVDVGKYLHYEIDEWFPNSNIFNPTDPNLNSKCRILTYGKCTRFDELIRLMFNFNVRFCIIDAMPERRSAMEFALKLNGRVSLCFYGKNIRGKATQKPKDIEQAVTVDRTYWLDLSLGRFFNQSIVLPQNIDKEYRTHIKAQARIYEKDRNGNAVARYVTEDNAEDHYGHARNYSEIALPFALGLGTSHNLTNIM